MLGCSPLLLGVPVADISCHQNINRCRVYAPNATLLIRVPVDDPFQNINIGAFNETLADNTKSFPGLFSVDVGHIDDRFELHPAGQLLKHEVKGLHEIGPVPLSGVSVRLIFDGLMPAAFFATTAAICWTVTEHEFEPDEHVLPLVDTNRPACSTASCSVCNVSIEKHMLATENNRKVKGSPIIVNSSV